MVPLRSATTLLGTPALLSDCAPMMLRVRPAQLTTTNVSGEGAMSCTRNTNSAPGTLMPVGIEIREYSSYGRLSSTTMSVLARINALSLSALTLGVWLACSMNSPNALLGTCTPENSSNPAAAQAATPPSRYETSLYPDLPRISAARVLRPSLPSISTMRVARQQLRKAQFEPAQRQRARPQQMILRKGEFLAQVDQRQLSAVTEHGFHGGGTDRAKHRFRLGFVQDYDEVPVYICATSPVLRSILMRGILSRLVPVTRMKRA